MEGNFEIRVFGERYNVRPEYYQGKEDVVADVKCKSGGELLTLWELLLNEHEGDTYSVWDGDTIITGGAYDPGDCEYIREYLSQ